LVRPSQCSIRCDEETGCDNRTRDPILLRPSTLTSSSSHPQLHLRPRAAGLEGGTAGRVTKSHLRQQVHCTLAALNHGVEQDSHHLRPLLPVQMTSFRLCARIMEHLAGSKRVRLLTSPGDSGRLPLQAERRLSSLRLHRGNSASKAPKIE
jgi:hypothetical protein